MSLMTTPKHPTSLYQNKRNLERSPYFAMKNLPLGGCKVVNHLSPSSSSAYSSKEKILFLLSLFLSLPRLQYMFFSPPDDPLAIRASDSQNFLPIIQCVLPQCLSSPPFFSFFSPIYITPQDLNLPKKKVNSLISSLLFSISFFFKSLNSKAIFLISNPPPKPSKESPTFLKLQW